jgi:hypothetical protein
LSSLTNPASFTFAPDGHLFYGERITGNLEIATWNSSANQYEILPTPFRQFLVLIGRHRSSGLKGFVFDPNFTTNGYMYAFYMQDNPQHNQVVRIQASAANSNVSTRIETILMEVPFNSTTFSGSHNGGDLVFGEVTPQTERFSLQKLKAVRNNLPLKRLSKSNYR